MVQDILAFKIAGSRDIEVFVEDLCLSPAQNVLHFLRRPDVELPLLSLAVGILRRVESSGGIPNFPLYVPQRLLHNLTIERSTRSLIGLHVKGNQQGVVIKHLLEMGNQPAFVDRVSMEAPAELIVDTSPRHLVEAHGDHFQSHFGTLSSVIAKQKGQGHGAGKFRGASKTSVPRIPLLPEWTEEPV